MRVGGRAAVSAAVVLCCGLMAPAIADAKIKPVPTQITLAAAGQSISGELQSSFKRCLRERTVTGVDSGNGRVFLTTTTDRKGSFSIALADIPIGITGLQISVASKQVGSHFCEAETVNVATDQATLSGGPVGGAFGGVLSSSVDACEPGRRIDLYEVSSDPVFVGWNITDASGAWTIAQAGGLYEARADAVLIVVGDTLTYCRALVSPAWFFEEPPEQTL